MAAVLGSSAVFLDSTVVNVALPRIGRELPVHLFAVLEGQSYIYSGYLLSLSALLIPAGALSDLYGRRLTFALGLGGFGLTSLLCGVATSMELLIVFRVLQGAAGALLVPGSLALIRSRFEGVEQGRAIGVWAAASSGTTLLGPLVGGLLVDSISWRLAFLMNLPILAIGLWALLRHTPESRDPESRKLDWIGAILVGLAVGGLTFGAIYGQQRQWQSPLAFVALGVGMISSVALPLWMRRTTHPLVPLDLFKSRNFNVINIVTVLVYGALYVTFYYIGLYVQGVLGYTAAAAGISALPGGIILTLLSTRFGALSVRCGPRPFLVGGPVLMAVALLWYARLPLSSTGWHLSLSNPTSLIPPISYFIDLFPPSIVFGIGISMLVAPLTATLMASVPEHNAGVASALNNAVSRVGPQLFGAVAFIALTAVFYTDLASRVSRDLHSVASPLNPPLGHPELAGVVATASTQAFHVAMILGAVMLLGGALASMAGLKRTPAASS